MRFGKRHHSGRTRARSTSAVHRTNRLLVETLERRGMLSATIGSLADQAIEGVTPAEEYVAPAETCSDAGDGTVGLPKGMSLVICPMVNWAETNPSLIASTASDGGVVSPSLSDPSSGVLGAEGPLMCTGYPAPRFTLSGPSDSPDLAEPETVELPPNVWERGIEDPMVVTDPIVADPIEVRSAFVSSDSGWAAYYYCVGPDGVVENIAVVASHDEPTIAAFVADHGNDPGVAVYDDGYSWYITGFPLELAPPVPEKAEFWGWSESNSPVDATVPDGSAMDEGGQFTPEYQYDEWAFSTYSFDVSDDRSDGVVNDMSFASLDGQAVQRGFTPQVSDDGAPRFAAGASNSRPMGELAAAALWLNLSTSDAGGMQLPGVKRRSR